MARQLAGRDADEKLRLRFVGGPKPINRPNAGPGCARDLLQEGEEFDATWLWVRQRWPFWLAGYFEELESEKAAEPSRCTATTNAGTQCKRTAVDGGEFCSSHGG